MGSTSNATFESLRLTRWTYCIDCQKEGDSEYWWPALAGPHTDTCLTCGGHNVHWIDELSRHLLDRIAELESRTVAEHAEAVLRDRGPAWERLAAL